MKNYAYRFGIAIDQLVNTAIGGYPNETLSARAWRHGHVEGKKPWGHFRFVIDGIFFFDRDHCEKSYLNTKRVTKNVCHYLPLHCKCTHRNIDVTHPIDYVDPDDLNSNTKRIPVIPDWAGET